MLIFYIGMIETEEEKDEFEALYLKYRNFDC